MSTAYQLDHVAIAVPRMAHVAALVVGELGGKPVDGGPGPGFTGAQWSFAGGGRLEVLEPVGPADGFLHRFLAAHGAGVHHATFKVPSLTDAVQRARAFGHQVVGFDDSNPRWKEAFLHPKGALGIVVQLAEAHPELGEGDWTENYPFPPSPAAASPAACLVGLRLSATSRERAERQWGELLGGKPSFDGELLVFEWNDSPLRIAVAVDARAPEGPFALELETEREVPDSDAARAVIGTRLVSVSRKSSPG